jgi:hypothetical protein
MDSSLIGFTAIILIFGMPLLIALVIAIVMLATHHSKRSERERSRKMYEELVKEKLGVLKTAIAMNYSRDDIAQLDRRLEEVIGTEKMASLLDNKTPHPPKITPEMAQADLLGDLEDIRQQSNATEQ